MFGKLNPNVRPIVRTLVLVSGIVMSITFTSSALAQATMQATREVSKWNLKKSNKLAIQGYDPVAYFPEGGGKPTKGSDSITADYEGATYRFATTAHRDAFLADPSKYEPAHGGWCSWAIKDGEKVDIDPNNFIVQDGRLFLFYDGVWGNTRSKWVKMDHAEQAAKADAQWKKLSGEEPHMGKPANTAPMSTATASPEGSMVQPVLQPKLDAIKNNFASKMPAETSAKYEQGIKEVATSGVLATALKVGDTAPDFSLLDATNKPVSLKAMLAKGPVVMTWYRGQWCPYCNLQLREYQEALSEVESAGAQLVAISPQSPDNSLTTAEKNSLTFAVLSDKGNAVAKQYGIAFTLPEIVAGSGKNKFDLSKYNGDSSNQLPLSATYVIAKNGTIAYAFVDADYRNRAEPGAIIAALKTLK